MRKFLMLLKSNYLLLILVLILLLIFVINFRSDSYLMTNDNYSPEINPSLSLNRSIFSPSWRDYRGLGILSDSEQSDVFRSLTFVLIDFLLPSKQLSQVYVFSALLFGVLGMYFLSGKTIEFLGIKINKKLGGFASALIYLTTLWTIWIFNFPVMPYVNLYGFLPLTLYFLLNFINIRNLKNALLVILSTVLISSSFVISTLFIVFIAGVFFFLWSILFKKEHFIYYLKGMFYGLSLIVLTQLFWILPFTFYLAENSTNIQNSNINESITNSTIDLEKEKMTFNNSIRFHTRVLDIFENSRDESKMFVNSDDYNNLDILKILSYLPFLLLLIGLFFAFYNKNFGLIPFFTLFIIALFGMKNSNEPLGNVYKYFQENLDFFRQVFRWSTSKFGTLLLLSISLFGGIGLGYINDFFIHFKRQATSVINLPLIFLYAICQLGFGFFLFNGNLFALRNFTQLPDEYYNLKSFIYENKLENSRLVVLPPSNLGYFREYSFGFYGSGFLHYLIPNPLMEKALVVGSQESEDALKKIEQAYFANDIERLNYLLDIYDIEYILNDINLIDGRYGYKINWSLDKNILNSYNKVFSSGNITLLKVPNHIVENSTFTNLNFLNSKNDLPSKLNPLSLKLNDVSVDGGKIVGNFTSNLSDYEILDIDWDELPSVVKYDIESSTVTITPAFPQLGNKIYSVPQYLYTLNNTNFNYLIIGQNVISTKELENADITVDTKFADAQSIKIDTGLTKVNIMPRLLTLKVSDCSGKQNENQTEVEKSNGSLIMRSKNSEACLNYTFKNNSSISVVELVTEYVGEGSGLFGSCILSNSLGECLNSSRYYLSKENDITVFNSKVLNDTEYTSILPSFLNTTEEYQEIKIKKMLLNTYSFKKLNGKYFKSVDVSTSEYKSNQVIIPILKGEKSFNYTNFNLATLPFGADRLNTNLQTKVDSNKVVTIANGNLLTQYTTLNISSKSSDYIYLAESGNLKGFSSSICIKHSNSPICLVEDSFNRNDPIWGMFQSEYNSSNLEAQVRTFSYSTISENTLESIKVAEIPKEWKNLLYIDESKPKLDLIYDLYPADPIDTSSIFYRKVEESGLYAINQSKSKYWSAYLLENNKIIEFLPYHLKQFVIPILSKRIPDENIVNIDGWRQSWLIENNNDSFVYVIFTPNSYAFVGYFVLVITIMTILTLYVKEKIQTWKK